MFLDFTLLYDSSKTERIAQMGRNPDTVHSAWTEQTFNCTVKKSHKYNTKQTTLTLIQDNRHYKGRKGPWRSTKAISKYTKLPELDTVCNCQNSAEYPHEAHVPDQTLTSHKLNTSRHSTDGARDQIRDTASHERRECHQQEQPTADPCHHRADPPLQTGDAVETGVSPALLQHDRSLPLLIPHRVGAPAESTKRHGLVHLDSQEPVGHEETHAACSGAKQGQKSPDDSGTCQTRSHG